MMSTIFSVIIFVVFIVVDVIGGLVLGDVIGPIPLLIVIAIIVPLQMIWFKNRMTNKMDKSITPKKQAKSNNRYYKFWDKMMIKAEKKRKPIDRMYLVQIERSYKMGMITEAEMNELLERDTQVRIRFYM